MSYGTYSQVTPGVPGPRVYGRAFPVYYPRPRYYRRRRRRRYYRKSSGFMSQKNMTMLSTVFLALMVYMNWNGIKRKASGNNA